MRGLAAAAVLACALAGPAGADEARPEFPQSDVLFRRLLADPRSTQTSLRYYRLSGLNIGEAALGNTWGMRRWGGQARDWLLQWDVGGMAYSRFHLTGGVNEFQTIDFFATLPLEARRGRFSARGNLFHESSHLGDDYIRSARDMGFRYSIEGFQLLASFEPREEVRVYGGTTLLLHAVPAMNSGMLQWGFELATPELAGLWGHACRAYLAQDFQSKGRVQWNLNSRTELGVRLGVPRVVRALRVHLGYFGGHSEFGQFYLRRENYFDFGFSFDF